MLYRELLEELQASMDGSRPFDRNSLEQDYVEVFRTCCHDAVRCSSCSRYLYLPLAQSPYNSLRLKLYGEVAGYRVQIGFIRENGFSEEHPVQVFFYHLDKYGPVEFERAVLLMAKDGYDRDSRGLMEEIAEKENELRRLKAKGEKTRSHIEDIVRLLSGTDFGTGKEMDAAFIRERRKAAGLTQKQLGQKIGKAEITIRQYEKGAITPSLEAKIAIARALDIGYGHLLSIETSKTGAMPVNGPAGTAYSHPSAADHERTDIKLPEDIMETFPDWQEIRPGSWSGYGKILTYEEGCKVEVGLYREPMDGGEYAGTYTLQVYNRDDVIFCSKVEEVRQ